MTFSIYGEMWVAGGWEKERRLSIAYRSPAEEYWKSTGQQVEISGCCIVSMIDGSAMKFAHLHVHSNFSFLDGGSSIADLVRTAAAHGADAMALTDHDNVCGAVDFHRVAQEYGIKPIQGAELTLVGGRHLVLLADGPGGYENLCRLLTEGHAGGERGKPRLEHHYLENFSDGLFALSGCRRGDVSTMILRGDERGARRCIDFYREIFADRFLLEIQPAFLPGDRELHRVIRRLGKEMGVEVVATNNVHYADKAGFPMHDLLTCIRNRITLYEVARERPLNAENYLKSPRTMCRYFRSFPAAVENAARIAAACDPALQLGERRHPSVDLPPGITPEEQLRRRAYGGARRRYGTVDARVQKRLEHELSVIFQMGYAEYFLLVEDVVRFAREKGIRHAGRGSAADSVVAYCLGITDVDALERGLLFERFMSPERGERPDIDIDFDARWRDEVSAYVFAKYGREHVAGVATFQTFRARSAVRQFGQAMGYDVDELDRLAKRLPAGSDAADCRELVRNLPECVNEEGEGWERYEKLFAVVARVAEFPRHIGTHLGGLVISDRPLQEITPLQRSAKGIMISQFDKDGVEDLGLLKLDLLSLRTLSVVDDAVRNIQGRDPGFSCSGVPMDDEATFSMIRRGETLGVFQLESPAQRALQSRLGAEELEDLICSVALIRPGPVQGNMVEPFIARRRGEESVTHIHPALEPILEKTYGVVLFQEQVIEIAVQVAGFSPGEADRLRRAMSRNRPGEEMERLGCLFVSKARRRGVAEGAARKIFSYVSGYASYGFCEAHAAAFGALAYETAYLICHYPAEYFAAILSHQPMGYYPASTVANEARRRGVSVLPPDINQSYEDFVPEDNGRSIRTSLSRVRGMDGGSLREILHRRPFSSFSEYLRETTVRRDTTERLILCGAFSSLHCNRRALLWRLTASGRDLRGEVGQVTDFTATEKAQWERKILSMDVREHIMSFMRSDLARRGIIPAASVQEVSGGSRIRSAGIPVRPHRPPTKSGRTVVFLSLEDETGLVDVTVFPRTYAEYGHLIFSDVSSPLVIEGRVERRGEGVSIIADRMEVLSG